MIIVTPIIITLLLAGIAEAQPEGLVAIKAGANAATWDFENRTNKYGFSGGLAGGLQWPIGRFSLGGQVELLYIPRGADAVSDSSTWRQHYLDVAIEIRPEVRLGPVGGFLILGGSWGILLKATRYGGASGVTDDITDLLNRNDVALLVGAGVALHLPSGGLGPFRFDTVFLEARHDRGLIDIEPSPEDRAKNRTTSLMLGLSFALGSGPTAASAPTTGVTTTGAR